MVKVGTAIIIPGIPNSMPAIKTTKKVKYDDGKFFYLILAGDYGSLSQAKTVCKKLAYNKQSCVLK